MPQPFGLEERVLLDLQQHYGSVFSEIYFRFSDNRQEGEALITSTDILCALLALKKQRLVSNTIHGRWNAKGMDREQLRA